MTYNEKRYKKRVEANLKQLVITMDATLRTEYNEYCKRHNVTAKDDITTYIKEALAAE